jgi:hypothetical protein
MYVVGVGIKEWGRQTVEHELCRGERRVGRERSAETRNGAHAMDKTENKRMIDRRVR